jgi:carbon storage regulator
MLVLSRKETQRIRLGDSIVVTVVRVSGDKVRLGIEAPADMLVLRDELEPRAGAQEAGPAELTVELNLPEVAEESVPRQQVA